MENNNDDGNGKVYSRTKTLNEIISASPYKLSEERERELLGFERKNSSQLLYEKAKRFKDVVLQATIGTKNNLMILLYKAGIALGITSIEEINNKKISQLENENEILQSRINSFSIERENIKEKLNELYSLKNDAKLCYLDKEYVMEECIINLEQLRREEERFKESMNNNNDEITRNSLVDISAEIQSTENALDNAKYDLETISTKIVMTQEEIIAYEDMLAQLNVYINKDRQTLSKNRISLKKLNPLCNYYLKPIEVAESAVRSEKMRTDMEKAAKESTNALNDLTKSIADSKTTMSEEPKNSLKKELEKKSSDIIALAKKIIMKK